MKRKYSAVQKRLDEMRAEGRDVFFNSDVSRNVNLTPQETKGVLSGMDEVQSLGYGKWRFTNGGLREKSKQQKEETTEGVAE